MPGFSIDTASDKEIYPNYHGLTTRVTSGGVFVCKLHYAADPYKNPAHPRGREWLKMALNGYPDGIEDPNWLKEMEIKYTAGAGGRIFPYWRQWMNTSRILFDGAFDERNSKYYASYDHGYSSPACYLVHVIEPDGLRRTVWEFYAAGVEVHYIAKIIRGEDVVLPDGRMFEGNPYAGKESMKICDPEIMRKTQVMTNGPNKSIADLFARDKVFFTKGSRGDDITVANWLNGNLWLNPDEPSYQIHERCEKLIWELGRLQKKSISPLQAKTRNVPEGIVDKNNHAWDALKYWLKRFPVGYKPTPQPKAEADFSFWRDRSKSKVKMSYVREFAR